MVSGTTTIIPNKADVHPDQACLIPVVGGGRYGLFVPMTSYRLPGPAPRELIA
jgi:hypothetical protein